MSNIPDDKISFYTQAAIIDGLIHAPDLAADTEIVAVVLDAIRSDASLRDHFFRNRPSTTWLPLLWKAGFFSEPPPFTESERGPLLQRWDVQTYLASIASEAPRFVLRHIATIKAHPYYINNAVSCLLYLLPEQIEVVEDALPYIFEWLNDLETANQLRFTVEDLVQRLAENGYLSALDLFAKLIRPFTNPAKSHQDVYLRSKEAFSVIGKGRFAETGRGSFRNTLELLAGLDLRRLISIYENALHESLRLEVSGNSRLLPSTLWRSAIEQSSQNWHHHYKDDLLDALRDSAEHWLTNSSDGSARRELLERYLDANENINKEEPFLLLRRLGLHLIRIEQFQFFDLVCKELFNAANYDDTRIHHEFLRLLEDKFTSLDKQGRQRIFDIIEAGPPQDRIAKMSDWAEESASNNDHTPDKERFIRDYIRYWKLNRLWLLRKHLDGTPQGEELESLCADRGVPEHPTFLSWHSGMVSISDVSPLPTEQISAFQPEKLLDFLRDWQPPTDRFLGQDRVTRRGLSSTVAEVVASNVLNLGSKYVVDLCLLHPTYAYALINRLTQSAKIASEFTPKHWALCIGVCEKLLENNQLRFDMDRVEEFGWRSVRFEITCLLEAGVNEEGSNLPPDLLHRVRDLLILLSSDPDPVAKHDQPDHGWADHDDPHTDALNHVRPRALQNLIFYAFHVARQNWNANASSGEIRHLEACVRDAFDSSLSDPSLAVHSIYGGNLMDLFWLDRLWVEEKLSNIFPRPLSEDSLKRYIVAWESYVTHNEKIYNALCVKLFHYYEEAIENIRRGYTTKTHLDPVQGLISHLLFFYTRQQDTETLDEEENELREFETLFPRFFENMPGANRGKAAWAYWSWCKERVDAGANVNTWWPAAKRLWEERTKDAISQNFPSDFDQEVGWFAQLLDLIPNGEETLASLWPLLQGTLPYVTAGFYHDVWESLERFIEHNVTDDPVRAIELYAQMHERSPESGTRWDDGGCKRRILESGCSHSESRRDTLALLDSIARRGDTRYSDIYEQYAR